MLMFMLSMYDQGHSHLPNKTISETNLNKNTVLSSRVIFLHQAFLPNPSPLTRTAEFFVFEGT